MKLSRRELPIALDAHRSALRACRACRYAPAIRPTISLARAPKFMLVGQAPGITETGNGRPFSGRAGRTLFKWLEVAGLDEATARDIIYIAAVTRCYPGPHPSGRGDRVPNPAERKRCGSWLEAELEMIRPPLIIPVGRLAIERFLGARPLDEVVGLEHNFVHPGGRSIVIPLPHPSGASSWIHAAEHRALLDQSLGLLRERFAARGRRP